MEQVGIRAAEPSSPFTLNIDSEKDKLGFSYRASLPSEIEKPAMAMTDILRLVEDKARVSRTEIHDKLGRLYGRRLLDKTLKRMTEDKILFIETGEHRRSYYRKLTEEKQLLLNSEKESGNTEL